LDESLIVNGELKRIWKEAAMTSFKEL